MLSLIRNVQSSFQSVLSGEWSRWPFGAPKMLSRMTLGVVGMGRIGEIVARYGEAFGMNVFYYDPYVDHARAKRVNSIKELVRLSNVVSLHLHLNQETEGMFDKEVFKEFGENSYLINTSRGAIVNTDAMLDALNSGRLSGAAIDVLDDEFEKDFDLSVKEHPLVQYALKNTNLLITPHIAGSTVDAWYLTQRHTIECILKVLKSNG